MSDVSDQIETNAQQPKTVSVDGQTVTEHSLRDQIEADKYNEGQAAVRTKKRGMILTKLKPGGTVN